MNKKGDFASIVFAVVTIFVIGVVFLLTSQLKGEIYSSLQSNLNESFEDTEALTALAEIKETEQVIWDYAFMGIFLGMFMVLGLTAYSVRISPVFYWIYGLMCLTVLATGVIVSNIWQKLAAAPEFAVTITQFPMTNAVLGSYYPLITTVMIMLAMIFLFGKPPGEEG